MIRILKYILLTLLVGSGSFGASLLGIWLYQKMQTVDMTLHYDITETMTQLDAVDARWNEDILKSRLRLNKNYDPLVKARANQQELGKKLITTLEELAASDTTVLSTLATYHSTTQLKLDQAEQFKSQNAILRNSAEYIAFSIHNLSDNIQAIKADSPIQAEALLALEKHLRELILDLLQYTSESYSPEFLNREIQTLERFSQQQVLPNKINRLLTLVILHVKNVIRKKPVVDNLLNSLVSLPTGEDLNNLRIRYSNFHRQSVQDSSAYQWWFFTYLMLLTIGIAYLILYCHLSHKRHIQHLTAENADLESQIALAQELAQAREELDQSQLLLIQSEKMSALGQMVAGVAHEINTPLAYSRSNVELIHEQFPTLVTLVEETSRQAEMLADPETSDELLSGQFTMVAEIAQSLRQDDIITDINDLLQASMSGLDQIADMVLNLKNFSRVDRKKVDQTDLNEGLNSALLIAQHTLKHKVDIVKIYGELPFISCSPSQINQVFLNLLVNAAQAIEDQGIITLTTLDQGDHVEVRIEDNGPGIPEDVLTRIFEPFYTTKDVGEGTGLGLAISYRIIEQHNGTISVQSEVGAGTRFTITLPVTAVQDAPDLAEDIAMSHA